MTSRPRTSSPDTRAANAAAVGFCVKSGWASAVLLVASSATPRVADSRRVDLSDPAVPQSRQPYHAGFGTARAAGPDLAHLVQSVEVYGRRSVSALLRQYETAGHQLRGAGLVVGSLIDPKRIGNDHIRIHALEGRLFRQVIEQAVAASRVPCSIWRERDLHGAAAGILKRPEQTLRKTVAGIGSDVTGSWRAEQKAAALAAWLVLAERAPARR